MAKKSQYGGQAVIEGVMMRGKEWLAIAVRRPDGEIIVKKEKLNSITQKLSFLKWPFFRGVVALIETLIIGMKAITFSANQALDDEEEAEELSFLEMFFSILLAFGMAVLLFIALPAWVVKLIQGYVASNLVLNLIEGIVKASAFIGYILVISLMKDIRRIFEYHGAEHVTIHAYEKGEELTIENARKYSPLHPRCGTNFIFVVIIISIIFFSFFGRPAFLKRILIHLALLPVIAGTAYEVIKKAGGEKVNPIIYVIAQPGIWLQKLTTRTPSDDQIEVAIASLKAVLEEES
ncbi:hypothetical protein BBF96_11795 [Anoxybacter fermentans]|uniref:Metal-dependent enzyme n=1 Tax=Anoxybacter fermentans TaxID=1323375 RepID=A0A3S9T0I3_9FIRM|nr:DUF1385 domain-containing protein [Anoxybacter fermentans]AZR74015.1 hypothetical protein BBF96_11795 [Anoxybacter fermentans]